MSMFLSLFLSLILIGVVGFFAIRAGEKKSRAKREAKRMEEETYRKAQLDEEMERKKLDTQINNLADSIIKDWNSSVRADKVETPGLGTVIYKFENGDIIRFYGKTLKHNTRIYETEYSLGLIYQARFRGIFNRIVEIINEANAARSSKYSDGGSTYSRPRSSSQSSNKTTSSNPKQRRYDIIMDTIKLRRESLGKMSKNDPARAALERELEVAEKKASDIKNELLGQK